MGSTLTTAIPGATHRFQGKESTGWRSDKLKKSINEKLRVKNRPVFLKPHMREEKEPPKRKKLALLNWKRSRSCVFTPTACRSTLNSTPTQCSLPCVEHRENNALMNGYTTLGTYSASMHKEKLVLRLDANSNFETCWYPQVVSPLDVSFNEIAYIDQSDSSSENVPSKQPVTDARVGIPFSSSYCRLCEHLPSPYVPNNFRKCTDRPVALPRSTPHSMYELCSATKSAELKMTTGTQTVKLEKSRRNKKSSSFPHFIGCYFYPSVQASTGELLRCFGIYLYRKCHLLKRFNPQDLAIWLQRVDHTLLVQGWQDFTFINPANLIFMFMLTREAVVPTLSSESELQRIVLTCFYLSYAYMGNEISYPLKPFLVDADREKFWSRCLMLIDNYSGNMLKINSCPAFFGEMILELATYGKEYD
ncbi:Cdk5 activator protein [Trichuris trichiura]|uniref:Cdk5 activator protein n=1 Tax=Trichuris trichiura TaxID=36087 RepID=A0A077ZCB5_TRITR|nr:Cdk5 activator protein [Trichuris trichiura]